MNGHQHGHGEAEPPRGVAPAPAKMRGTRYTCPMHPQMERDAPGSCPICGMALEPVTPTAGAADDAELREMTRRFWFAAALAVPLLVVAMGDAAFGPWLHTVVGPRTRVAVELLLATPICTWAAWPFYVRAVQSVRNRSLNMFTLIGLGVGVAYTYSLVAALAPALFPAAFRDAEGQVAVYFEAAGTIVALILLGQVLELRARSRTSAAIQQLLELAPGTARRIRTDNWEQDIPLDEAQLNDRLRVRPGE